VPRRRTGCGPVDSWTFYGSRYTSPYLSFLPVERYSNVRVNAKASPDAPTSYRALQPLTPARPSSEAPRRRPRSRRIRTRAGYAGGLAIAKAGLALSSSDASNGAVDLE
jgi:hypothetical protein